MWNWFAALLQKLDRWLHPARYSMTRQRSNLHARRH